MLFAMKYSEWFWAVSSWPCLCALSCWFTIQCWHLFYKNGKLFNKAPLVYKTATSNRKPLFIPFTQFIRLQLNTLEEMVWISVCLIPFCNFTSAVISEKVQEYSTATKDVAYDVGCTYLSREHLELLLLIEPVESSWVAEWQVPFLNQAQVVLNAARKLPEEIFYSFSLKSISF